MNNTFAENLKYYRTLKGLKQVELAEMLGISQNTLSRWELGRSTPDTELLVKLMKILDVEVDKLVPDVEIGTGKVNTSYASIPIQHLDILEDCYRKLNVAGQREIIKRAKEVTRLPEYQRNSDYLQEVGGREILVERDQKIDIDEELESLSPQQKKRLYAMMMLIEDKE